MFKEKADIGLGNKAEESSAEGSGVHLIGNQAIDFVIGSKGVWGMKRCQLGR